MPESTSLSSNKASTTLTPTQVEVNQSKEDLESILKDVSQRKKQLELVSGTMPEAEVDYWEERLKEASTRVNALTATVAAQSQPSTNQTREQTPSGNAPT